MALPCALLAAREFEMARASHLCALSRRKRSSARRKIEVTDSLVRSLFIVCAHACHNVVVVNIRLADGIGCVWGGFLRNHGRSNFHRLLVLEKEQQGNERNTNHLAPSLDRAIPDGLQVYASTQMLVYRVLVRQSPGLSAYRSSFWRSHLFGSPRLEYPFAQALNALDSGPANLKNIRAEVSAIVIRLVFM